MAEPKTLDEALEWYQNDKFSRKSLFGFVVAELKALRQSHEELKSRVSDYMVDRVANGHKTEAIPAPAVSAAADANREAARQRMKEYWAKKKAEKAVQEASANG